MNKGPNNIIVVGGLEDDVDVSLEDARLCEVSGLFPEGFGCAGLCLPTIHVHARALQGVRRQIMSELQ